MAFMCKAFRAPTTSGPFVITSVRARLEAETFKSDSEKIVDYGLTLNFIVYEDLLPELGHNCWQQLLDLGVVANSQKYDLPNKISGKGLEVSFDLLVALLSVEYPFLVGDTIVLLEYRIALIPTLVHENFVQYHLEISDSGQINPHLLDLKHAATVTEIATLRERRCFLGWCEEA